MVGREEEVAWEGEGQSRRLRANTVGWRGGPRPSKGRSLRKTPRISADGQISGERTQRSLSASVEANKEVHGEDIMFQVVPRDTRR